jgi:hypothetical protein
MNSIGNRGSTGYFSGIIDNISIYNRALSTEEIQTLSTTNLAKYASNRRTFTSILSGLAEGTYLYSGTATDLAGNISGTATRTLIIDRTAPNIAFTGSTSANGTFSSGTLLTGQIDITELNLGQFIRNRNGSGYSAYDS